MNSNELFKKSLEELQTMEKRLWDFWQKVSNIVKVKEMMKADDEVIESNFSKKGDEEE
jgi:hypothetical protein